LLTYFTTTIWVVNKKSYKKQKKKVGFELFSNKPIILAIAKGAREEIREMQHGKWP
jgi:hypothetical protein